MATIQKRNLQCSNIVDAHIWLIDQIREETLDAIANYLKNMNIHFDYLPDFLENPIIYPGKTVGLKQIIERFLDKTISKYYKKIQVEGLPIKFVIDNVRKNLFQGGWDIRRYSDIMVATRGGGGARKALSASRTDEPPRLLSFKKKVRKAKLKPKKRGPKVISFKFPKEGAKLRGSCDYCGGYIKIRYTSNFSHVNICQNPKNHYFCSKECKINWISTLLERKVKPLEVRI